MAQSKPPYVQIASVCERVLQEEDGVLTAVRLIDVVTLKNVTLPADVKPTAGGQPTALVQVMDFVIVVSLKAGDLKGEFRLALRMRDPKGTSVQMGDESPVVLKGNDGVNLRVRFGLPFNAPLGQYWFEVLWNGDELTRIPLTLKREEPASGEASTTQLH